MPRLPHLDLLAADEAAAPPRRRCALVDGFSLEWATCHPYRATYGAGAITSGSSIRAPSTSHAMMTSPALDA